MVGPELDPDLWEARLTVLTSSLNEKQAQNNEAGWMCRPHFIKIPETRVFWT